jgi:hypothetical protein
LTTTIAALNTTIAASKAPAAVSMSVCEASGVFATLDALFTAVCKAPMAVCGQSPFLSPATAALILLSACAISPFSTSKFPPLIFPAKISRAICKAIRASFTSFCVLWLSLATPCAAVIAVRKSAFEPFS